MGVPVDTADDYGNTCLHVACQGGSKRMVKACLRWGADINQQNVIRTVATRWHSTMTWDWWCHRNKGRRRCTTAWRTSTTTWRRTSYPKAPTTPLSTISA